MSFSDFCVFTYDGVPTHDGVANVCAFFYDGVGHYYRALDIGIFTYCDGAEQNGIFDRSVYHRSLGNQRRFHFGRIGNIVRRLSGVTAVYLPLLVLEVEPSVSVENIHIRFPKRGNGSYVLPIAVELIRYHLLIVGKHFRDYVFTEIVFRRLIRFVLDEVFAEFFPGEDIYTHRSLCALGLLGFFLKFVNLALFVEIHNSETRRLLDGYVEHRYRAIGVLLFVHVKHCRIIHFINVVA